MERRLAGNFAPAVRVACRMKILCAAAAAALVGCGITGTAQTVACGQVLDAPLRPGSTLLIDSRPAGLEIAGADSQTIHVTCSADHADSPENYSIQFSGGPHATLRIRGGSSHHGGVEVHISVPRRSNLQVEMGAGEVTVRNVRGDKDIDLYAGQVTISSPERWDYRSVDASVDIGEVKAAAYGEDTGGFFRSFSHRDDAGEYRLHVHVMTGEIDLFGASGPSAAD